jgi:hypothetical protein
MVWTEGMSDWMPFNRSQLSGQTQAQPSRMPPAIPPVAHSQASNVSIPNEIAWTLSLIPLGFLFLDWTIRNSTVVTIIAFLANSILCIADHNRLKKAGHKSPNLLWLIVIPIYLFLRSKLLKQSYAIPIVWIVTFVLYLVLSPGTLNGINNASVPAVKQGFASPNSKQLTFNTSDKTITSNGNMLVAYSKISSMIPESTWAWSDQVPIATLTKTPYSYIGKLIKLNGQVYKIEQLPPEAGRNGEWYEALLLCNNPNSPLGTTTIDFIFQGDGSSVNGEDYLTCGGYFVGTYESQNAMGGTVEAMALIGNVYKKSRNSYGY